MLTHPARISRAFSFPEGKLSPSSTRLASRPLILRSGYQNRPGEDRRKGEGGPTRRGQEGERGGTDQERTGGRERGDRPGEDRRERERGDRPGEVRRERGGGTNQERTGGRERGGGGRGIYE